MTVAHKFIFCCYLYSFASVWDDAAFLILANDIAIDRKTIGERAKKQSNECALGWHSEKYNQNKNSPRLEPFT